MKINEKNLCTFACTPPVDLEGWLNKRGEINKSWQRRYFILKGNLLFYFEKRGDKEPLGVIILEGCTIELAEDGEQYCFQIVFHGVNNRIYFLSAETQELMEQWMKALTCAGYEYMKLMVSELQRQLDEIEGTKGLTPENTPLAPKPPPRRQNPFNRPAPLPPPKDPPPLLNDASHLNSAIHSSCDGFATTTTTTTATTATTITTTTASATSSTASHNNINNTNQNDNNKPFVTNTTAEEALFCSLHEAFGKEIIKHLNETNNARALAEAPLIVL